MHYRHKRSQGKKKRNKKICIATEGEVHEKIYFEGMKKFTNDTILLEVIASNDGNSSPCKILNSLLDCSKEIRKYHDELWLVVDVDRWVSDGKLKKVVQTCLENNISLGISNPCFEIWLILHFQEADPSMKRGDYKKALSEALPPNTKKYDAENYMPFVDIAIERARVLDKNPKAKWPQDRGTHIYRLVEKNNPTT